jgi:hypothetical protein
VPSTSSGWRRVRAFFWQRPNEHLRTFSAACCDFIKDRATWLTTAVYGLLASLARDYLSGGNSGIRGDEMAPNFIRWLEDIGAGDTGSVGGKKKAMKFWTIGASATDSLFRDRPATMAAQLLQLRFEAFDLRC